MSALSLFLSLFDFHRGRSTFERAYHSLLSRAQSQSSGDRLTPQTRALGTQSYAPAASSACHRFYDVVAASPEAAAGPQRWPLVVFLHGGLWVASDKNDPDGVHERFLAGLVEDIPELVCLNVNYALCSRRRAVTMADQLKDVHLLLDTLQREDRFGCRETGVVLVGHSCGAHLAIQSLLALSEPTNSLLGLIRGVYSLSGVYDLHDFAKRCGFFERHFGLPDCMPRSLQERHALSPLHCAKKSLPFPVRLLHPSSDGFLVTQAQEFVLAMQAKINRASLRLVDGCDHFSILGTDPQVRSVVSADLRDFLKDCELVVRAHAGGHPAAAC